MSTNRKQALGQGLAALLGPDTSESLKTKQTISADVVLEDDVSDDASEQGVITLTQTDTLPVDALTAGKFQPRQNFDHAELEALAQSIREHGVLQPILVRPTSASHYEIIAGERRWRASKLAGLKEIPAIVKANIDDRQALEIGILENIQRNDLTTMEEARGYQRLMEEFDYTQEMLSQALGKSRSHVANMIRLLGLDDKAQEYLEANRISFGQARALISLTGENLDYVLDMIEKKNLTVRQTERLIRKVHTYGVPDSSESFDDAGDGGHMSARSSKKRTSSGDDFDEICEGDFRNMANFLEKMVGGNIIVFPKGDEYHVRMKFENIERVDRLLLMLNEGSDFLLARDD